MNVAVVYQYYQGRSAPGHSLVYELTQHLAQRGHEVTVISGETGYMRTDQPALPWYRRLLRYEKDGLVNVIRTFTYTQLHRSYLGRLLSFFSFSVSAPIGLLFAKRPDVVLASSPPIFPMFSVWLVCKLRRIPMVFEVRDLWPESAVQMGILRSRVLISVMSWMEALLYRHAKRIVTLTAGIRDDIQARGWPAKKLEVITCGIDTEILFSDPAAGEKTRRQLGWEDCQIVLYLGAMGEANNLDVLLEAAHNSRNEKLRYLLVGDGMRRAYLEARIAELGLTNVRILPPVPKNQVRGFINAADICVVTLMDIPLFQGAIPTKLLDYMACARPVLCGVAGEAAAIVELAGAGLTFPPNDALRLAELVAQLSQDEAGRQLMGQRGMGYVQEHFNALHNRDAMEKLLLSVASCS
ncbi:MULTISPECIES: glycosyltransferase family 4 protein [Pseudomonas]|uniref:Alpha-D-kanosaminyltransferase n=1 Tax=Pseudomonas putida TaxID=303 RepID=A0A1B2F1C0_PSEPU|nr:MULTISPECIES: glycosyltransferase family 4 protein [Pseudomonas]ANY86040.1 Alpha-D-kanosaminyltransferase [Pseudomonas putida]